MATARLIERTCKGCGEPFSFSGHGRGLARLYCDRACAQAFHQRTRLAKPRPVCSALGCDEPAIRVNASLCEKHYYRFRRSGTFALKERSGRKMQSGGYVLLSIPGHPLAKQGWAYEHRVVLYDAIGPWPHPCHWCGRLLDWLAVGLPRLIVDHLNGQKADNRRENLVPSCHGCNVTRGAFVRWLLDHADDPAIRAILIAPS